MNVEGLALPHSFMQLWSKAKEIVPQHLVGIVEIMYSYRDENDSDGAGSKALKDTFYTDLVPPIQISPNPQRFVFPTFQALL